MYFNLGIIGHVDAGKTSLVKRLTTIASTACHDKHCLLYTSVARIVQNPVQVLLKLFLRKWTLRKKLRHQVPTMLPSDGMMRRHHGATDIRHQFVQFQRIMLRTDGPTEYALQKGKGQLLPLQVLQVRACMRQEGF